MVRAISKGNFCALDNYKKKSKRNTRPKNNARTQNARDTYARDT